MVRRGLKVVTGRDRGQANAVGLISIEDSLFSSRSWQNAADLIFSGKIHSPFTSSLMLA